MEMELTEAHKQEIERIVGELQCLKGFACYKSPSENICKTRDIGMEQYLECLDANAEGCEFSLPFGDGYFCTCPVQLYITKNLSR
jgi:hypothetical protein